MSTKSLKFAVLGIFASLATFGFLLSGSQITAQKKKIDILEKAAAYKSWRQPVKQLQNRPLEPLIGGDPAAISINTSSGFG